MLSRYLSPLSRVLAAVGMLVLSLCPRPASAELVGVAIVGNGGALYSVNQGTGAATLLTDTPLTHPSDSSLAFRQGALYANRVIYGKSYHFGTYDLATGIFTSMRSYFLRGLAYRPSNDLFYSVSTLEDADAMLVTLNPVTKAITDVGSVGPDRFSSLVFDQANGILYGISTPAFPDESEALNLVTINPATGAVTNIGATGLFSSNSISLAFDEDNRVLYMNVGASSSTPNTLFTVNTTTGAATQVGSNILPDATITGIAWRPDASISSAAPEPGTLALLGVGMSIVGLVLRRRK